MHVAAAILPQGIMALIAGGAAQFFPAIITKPRIFIPVGGIRESMSPCLLSTAARDENTS